MYGNCRRRQQDYYLYACQSHFGQNSICTSVQIRKLGPLLHDSSEDHSGALQFQSLGTRNFKMCVWNAKSSSKLYKVLIGLEIYSAKTHFKKSNN